MATLTASQIYTLLLQGGVDPQEARIMTAIAQAESARNPGAVGDVAIQTGTWGPSVGLFQIRTLKAETGTGSDRDIQRLMNNPAEQVKAALNISGGGGNYRPWSTYTNGSYRKFLDEPLQGGAALPAGFGAGAAPYGAGSYGMGTAAFAAGTNGADPFAMAPVPQPSGIMDQDADGLSDVYEQKYGTDPLLADTDRDGLADGTEIARGLNPRLMDSDNDGLADGFAADNNLVGGPGGAPVGPAGPVLDPTLLP